MRAVALTQAQAERFWNRVEKGPSCWLWTGQLNAGYGQFWMDGHNERPHRVSYETLIGPIPDGLHLDHLCRVRNCVNPAHLEPVTSAENTRRGTALITQCPQGHDYTQENTRLDGRGQRHCRICDRAYQKKYQATKYVCEGCGIERSLSHRASHLRLCPDLRAALDASETP